MELPFAESWKIKMVEPIRKSTREEREQWMKEADYNLFQLKSEQVYIDCLTDSGTGAMSDRQWAAMMMGDESYAGSSSFFQLKDTIERLTGFNYVIPTHQGRAAENVLFSHLVTAGAVVPGNSHFDTTKGHIESRKAVALDCTIDDAKNTQLEIPFKGNVDPKKLEEALPIVESEMTPEARAVVEEQGVVYCDRDGDLVTSIVNGKDCVFASRDENGGCICLIEKAYREGRTPWRKPISCYLYPVRLRKVGDFTAVNFHKWDVCSSAFIKGRRKGIRAYEFLKEPLIERFGREWYDELLVVAEELKKQNML